jgi:hypothetical protein
MRRSTAWRAIYRARLTCAAGVAAGAEAVGAEARAVVEESDL